MHMLTLYYVQVRRGGFQNPAPWGDKGNPFHTLNSAKDHIRGLQEMADKMNCVIDYMITDEAGHVVQSG